MILSKSLRLSLCCCCAISGTDQNDSEAVALQKMPGIGPKTTEHRHTANLEMTAQVKIAISQRNVRHAERELLLVSSTDSHDLESSGTRYQTILNWFSPDPKSSSFCDLLAGKVRDLFFPGPMQSRRLAYI